MFDTSYYNRPGAEELLSRLDEGPLLAQGPMGSALMSEWGAADIPPVYWNLAEPQTVANLHRLYKAAGAQVLITNTFQASAPALERDEIEASVEEVNRAAVDIARSAHPQLLLGSMGSCGIDWTVRDSPEYRAARDAYRNQARALFAAGVDAVLLETFVSIRELQPALDGCMDAADGMPVFASFVVDETCRLMGDGLNIEAAVVYAEKHGCQAVGVNCCSLTAATACVPRMADAARTPVMVRPNAGNPVVDENGVPRWSEDAPSFARACARWVEDGARLVGSCCGTTAMTTAALADVLGV